MARYEPEATISADQILEALKARIYSKLMQDDYEDDTGVVHEVLPASAMASLGNFILKLVEAEDKRALRNATISKVVAIPAMPALPSKNE